jgi:hypothetical protein
LTIVILIVCPRKWNVYYQKHEYSDNPRRTREKRKAGALAKADNQRRVVSRADWALRRRTIIRKGAHSTSRSHDSASD